MQNCQIQLRPSTDCDFFWLEVRGGAQGQGQLLHTTCEVPPGRLIEIVSKVYYLMAEQGYVVHLDRVLNLIPFSFRSPTLTALH